MYLTTVAALLGALLPGCGPSRRGEGDGVADVRASGDVNVDGGAADSGATVTPPLTNDGIASVTPSRGTSAGGVEVTLKGRGFAQMESVWFGESKALNVQLIDDETLRVVTPPSPPGFYDVVVVRYDPATQQSDELRASAAYHSFATVQVTSVSPAVGPHVGGAVTTVTGAGFTPGTHFVFGRRLAVDAVILDEFTATVLTPPGPVGAVDVSASNNDGSATLRDGYTYALKVEPKAVGVTVLPVTPDILAATGGTPIQVRWNGPPGIKLLAIRVGGLTASKVKASGSSAQALAPKGSPGPADVSLVFEMGGKTGVATRKDAVVYNVEKPFVAALLPGRGAQAGGTVVEVVGGGLHRLTTLRFADKLGKITKIVHPGLVRLESPRGDPGTVDVTANFSGAAKQVLFNAWAWFDPQQAGWGTWGGPIRGALNVTVRRADWPGGVVQGALVMIGESALPELSGVTDDRGQVTLSAYDLRGPVNVHASAAGFGAGSVVAFDAQHVTILIRKHPDPPTSKGQPAGPIPSDIFNAGTVNGRVRYVNKLLKLPMGACDVGPDSAALPSKDGQCTPCAGTCGGKLRCSGLLDAVGGLSLAASATTTTQRYCLRDCLTVADCDAGWECRAVGTPGKSGWKTQCVPRIGKPETRCATSSFSQFSTPPDPGAGAVAAPDGSFSIKTRLGELAVVCRAGYVPAGTDTFVPLIMGVARGVKVPDDKTPVKTEVWLDTPLTRVAHFALEPLPMGPETAKHRRFLTAWLDLDGEGFLKLGHAETTAVTNRLDVARMPSTLKGALKGLRWTVYAGMMLDDDDEGAPSSLAMDRDVGIESGDHAAWWPKDAAKPSESDAWSPPVLAVASGAAGLFAVGEAGRILRWANGGFTAQQSPSQRTLRTLWLDPVSPDGWIGGDDGLLLRRDAVVGWQVAASPTTARIVALSGGTKGPWMLDAAGALRHFSGATWQPIPGPLQASPGTTKPKLLALATRPTGVQAPAPAPVHDELWLAGEGGALYRGEPLAGGGWSWKQATQAFSGAAATQGATQEAAKAKLAATTWLAALTESVPNGGARVWLAGTGGALARVEGDKLTLLDSGTTQPLRALAARPGGGVFAVGGAGTWLAVSPAGVVTDHRVKGLEVDLHGLASLPAPGGGSGSNAGSPGSSPIQGAAGVTWIAAGLPTVRIAPYLPMPTITTPIYNSPVGNKIAWTIKPGPAAEMHQVQITTFWKQSYWQIYAPGNVQEITLPDFQQVGSWDPLPNGPLRVRVWRLYGPKLEVDHFNHSEMSPWYWQAWSYGWQLSHR